MCVGYGQSLAGTLMDTIYKDKGLNALTEIASEFMGNPVYVVDFSDRIIAACQQIQTSDTYMRPMVESGYLTDSETRGMRSSNLKKKIRNACAPFIAYRPEAVGGEAFILSPIRLQGELVAYSCCMALNRNFQDHDKKTMEVITQAFSIELQKSRIYQDTQGTKLGYQLLDVIFGEHPIGKLQFRGWTEQTHSYLLAIPYERQEKKGRANVLLHIFRQTFSGGIVALSNYGIIVLLTQDEVFDSTSKKYQQIEELMRLYGIRGGCSQKITNLQNCRQSFAEAKAACEIGEILRFNHPVVLYDEIFFYHMLRLCETQFPLENLCSPQLLKLRAYDQRKSSFSTRS